MYLWGLNDRVMIITKTPFRMSFFGGGTDIPSFFREHGGAVISTTFDKYCYVNVRHLPPFMIGDSDVAADRSAGMKGSIQIEKNMLAPTVLYPVREIVIINCQKSYQQH